MQAITAHVQAGEATAAWLAGEQMVSYVLTELMRSRLRMIAARHAKPRGVRRGDPADFAAELQQLFGRTVTVLQRMGDDVSVAFERQPTARELNAEVARIVLPNLEHLDDIVHGLGFMAEIGTLAETPYWMEWWQRALDGTFDRDYSHQLDPSRDDFYEYWSKSYMTRPKASGQPSAVGPYIDHGGVDDYVVTVSVPVMSQGVFVGIMAADIRVASLEQAVSAWLAQATGVCVLLNSDSRVLLSNSVRYNVGDLVAPDGDLELSAVGCFGWTIGRGADRLQGPCDN
jgi:hypothetical protein